MKKDGAFFPFSQFDCLATPTRVSDENKTHTINDYYCNFVLMSAVKLKNAYFNRCSQFKHKLLRKKRSAIKVLFYDARTYSTYVAMPCTKIANAITLRRIHLAIKR